MNFRFASLWLLLILLPLYGGFVFLWRQRQRHAGKFSRAPGAIRYPSTMLLAQIPTAPAARYRLWVKCLRLFSLLLLLLAMLRPQTILKKTQIQSHGIEIVLAIDTSQSMLALDLDTDRAIAQRRTRLEVVQSVVTEFVNKRDSDPIGIVVFGSQAYTQCPLTLDHDIVNSFLQKLTPGMAGDSTSIGSGMAAAINRLRKSQAKSKIVILLTDGRNNSGALSPRKAAEIAHTLGIRVYTIGAGGRGRAPFIIDGPFGKQVAYDDVDIDEETLQEIAKTTGAAYFRAEDRDTLAQIYERIDSMEKAPVQLPTYLETQELFFWFLIPALLLLIAEKLLLETRLSKIP